MLTASFRRSELRTPGLKLVGIKGYAHYRRVAIVSFFSGYNSLVNPVMTFAMSSFKSLYSGVLTLSWVVAISYRASFYTQLNLCALLTSMQQVMSLFSTRQFVERTALYGSMTVSDTFGEGKTENVASIRSGYSSRIFERISDPRPEPVPPPRAIISRARPLLTMRDLEAL